MVALKRKEVLPVLGDALKDYSRSKDLMRKTNLPVLRISDRTARRATSFLRAFEFPDTNNRITRALHELEDGKPDRFEQITSELRSVGIELEVRSTPLGENGECLVEEIIVLHRGNIHDQCGLGEDENE